MHVQRDEIIGDRPPRARRSARPAVLGGPSVSACPEHYPEFDYLHLGELGDATDALIAALDDDAEPAAGAARASPPTSGCRSPISRSPPTS